jgi:BON domain
MVIPVENAGVTEMKSNLCVFPRVIFSIVLLAWTIGCAKAANDQKVAADIQARLGADSGLQDKQISVQSANGTVTLSGTVDTQAERDAAAKYAAAEAGVRTVINNLQLGATPAATQSAPAPATSLEKSKPSPRRRRSERRQEEMARSSAPADPSQYAQTQPQPASSQPPAPAAAQQPVAPPPPPEPAPVTVPSGAVLSVRLVDAIDSATAENGDTFHATLDAPLAVDGNLVVPAHYDVIGHVVNAQASGKFRGQALLVLGLDQLKVGDKVYNLQTDQYKQETSARGKNTAEKVGAGAVAGAILGGIFGGGKGAAIGSAAGAGAGGGVQAAGKRPDIRLTSEKVLTFTLQAPVTLVPTTKPAREGQKLPAPSPQ